MIKIDLKDSQKQQIERNLEAFITKKNRRIASMSWSTDLP